MINRKTKDFNKLFEKLPRDIQEKAVDVFLRWKDNPSSIDCKPLEKFHNEIYSAKVGSRHRALARKITVDNNEVFIWMWVGSHEDYNNTIKKDLLKIKIISFREKVVEEEINKNKRQAQAP